MRRRAESAEAIVCEAKNQSKIVSNDVPCLQVGELGI